MKYGINLLLWTDDVLSLDFRPLLETIRSVGYDGVEVPIFTPDIDGFARFGDIAAEYDLATTGLTVRTQDSDLISHDREIRRRGVALTMEAIDCCQALGTDLLVGPFHSALGCFSGVPATPDQWKYAVEALGEVALHAEKCHVRMALEYLNRFEAYFLNSVDDTTRLIDEINHPNCRMMYDTFHAHIEEKSVTAAIRQGGDRIIHVHVSENDRSIPGTGQIRWDETFDTLAEIGYDGWLMVEAFGTALPGLAAATKIWRRMFPSEEQLIRDALTFTRQEWNRRVAAQPAAAP